MTAPREDEAVLAHGRECFDYDAASLQIERVIVPLSWHPRWSQLTQLALTARNDTSQISQLGKRIPSSFLWYVHAVVWI